MRYSVIIPVYNRPDEADELLQSLTRQSFKDFEVIIVEDGSSIPCKDVAERYQNILDIRYYAKPNSGPGQTRNYGAERSRGEYLIILDSDCILPEGYFAAVEEELQKAPADAFGGPDRAHVSFTDIQKAINYSMTSFFTTGGIRGGKKKMDKFYPRSFNMGVRREVYETLGGFSRMRFGEDIDFSIRIFKGGYACRLFPGAWVYHKRRTDLKKFFKQVHNSGIARINLYKKYPESLKTVHLLPRRGQPFEFEGEHRLEQRQFRTPSPTAADTLHHVTLTPQRVGQQVHDHRAVAVLERIEHDSPRLVCLERSRHLTLSLRAPSPSRRAYALRPAPARRPEPEPR